MRKEIIIHRDCGPGFMHDMSVSCLCRPHIFDAEDPRTTEEILAEIDEIERKGDA